MQGIAKKSPSDKFGGVEKDLNDKMGGVENEKLLTTRLAASRSAWAPTFGPQGGAGLTSRALFGAPGSGAPGASGAARRASPFVGETLEERGLEAVASFALRP